VATTDPRITTNWNPIAVEHRRHGTFTGLLYDPLVRTNGEEQYPWLAANWMPTPSGDLRVTLREASWHDGTPLTAGDVAFTYEFLGDTSMSGDDSPIPAPRFRGASSLVEGARVVDELTVDLEPVEAAWGVVERALSVPILPEHVWSDRTASASVAGVEVGSELTEALVDANADPVGSGPVRFAEATPQEEVVFDRNPDHFLTREPEGIPGRFHGKPAFDRLRVSVAPSDLGAVELVGQGDADGTASVLGPDAVPRIGREADVTLIARDSAAFYHVGFNARRAPMANPLFRSAVARLIDKGRLVEDAFNGHGRPAGSPLAASPEWVPDHLAYDHDRGVDPSAPFLDAGGELDVEAARELFREAGYRYDGDGRLLGRNQ